MTKQLGMVLRVRTPKTLAALLLVPLFVCLFLVTPTFADDGTGTTDTPIIVSPIETPPADGGDVAVIPSPGIPTVTSPVNDKDITWEWTAPTPPNTTPADPGVDPLQNPVSDSTDTLPTDITTPPTPVKILPAITGYGYELLKDTVVIQSGQVASDVLSVTTTVTDDGMYVFRIWTIAGELKSEKVEAQTTITTPVPPVVYQPIVVADLVPDTLTTAILSYVKPDAIAYANSTADDSTAITPTASDAPLSNAQVLAAQDTQIPETAVAVAKPSNQGWIFFGVPWYIWLLTIAILYTAYRWVRMVLANRE